MQLVADPAIADMLSCIAKPVAQISTVILKQLNFVLENLVNICKI
jgi:hypothetical protein